MTYIIRCSIILILFTSALSSVVFWHAYRQLQFVQRNMEWHWRWEYFVPLSNGIQATRTADTHQLMFRRVYLLQKVVIFVGTTLDNKYEVDIVQPASCQAGSQQPLSLALNRQPPSVVAMICEPTGEGYLYRLISRRLQSLTMSLADQSIVEDFAQWPVDELQVDQFKQQHADFFNQKNKRQGEEIYQWLRD